MMTYIDTSAFLAMLDPSDHRYSRAVQTWQMLVDREDRLLISSYVLIETISVLHRRFGMHVVGRFLADIMPVLEIAWMDVNFHTIAVSALLSHPGKGGPSLVDCMSFEVIRQQRIQDVFAYDKHFEGRGFTVIG